MTVARLDGAERRAGVAGTTQGLVLVAPVCLTVMAAVLMAPVIPRFVAHFAPTTPNAQVLVPVALTIPALTLALFSPVAGWIADKFGRKRLLVAALASYGVCGTAPLWLDGLPAIIASRALLGVTEAAIMTCTTTLIGDYWQGKERERWLANQAIIASLSAVVLIFLGGLLGEQGWRTPFWAYLLGSALAAPAALALWEPERRAEMPAGAGGLPWRGFGWICGLMFLGSVTFLVVPIHLGFVLAGRGVTSPQMVGLVAAAGSVATPLGAILFRAIADRVPPPAVVAAGFASIGAGLAVLALSPGYGWALAGSVLHGFGYGLLLPQLLTWGLGQLPFELRGRGTGVLNANIFFGQFISPIVVAALSGAMGGNLDGAILATAVLAAAVAVATVAFGRRRAEA